MFFAKMHPLLVHFPMALLFSGTIFQLFGAANKEETILVAGDFNIRIGLWTIPIVMAVGGMSLLDVQVEDTLAKDFLYSHILYAFLALIVFTCWVGLQKFKRKIWVDIIHYLLLLAGMTTIVMTGFYGGELVHRFGLPNRVMNYIP
tara:strand:+ start:314 stop:751 length:438 start_codon:yes stop_codon:yes gene_type:complete